MPGSLWGYHVSLVNYRPYTINKQFNSIIRTPANFHTKNPKQWYPSEEYYTLINLNMMESGLFPHDTMSQTSCDLR